MNTLLDAFEASLAESNEAPVATEEVVSTNTDTDTQVDTSGEQVEVAESTESDESNEESTEENTENGESTEENKAEVEEKPIGPVPYSRFKQKIQETNELKQKLSKVESELASIRATQAKLAERKIEEKESYETMEELAEITARKAHAKIQAEQMADAESAKTAEYMQTIVQSYEHNLQEVAKVLPEVIEADQFLSQQSAYIHPKVLETLLKDDNSPMIVNSIARSQDILDQVINGDPIETIVLISRMSAHYDGVLKQTKDTKKVESTPAKSPTALGSSKPTPPKVPKGAVGNKMPGIASKSVNDLLADFKKTGRNPFYS